MLFLIFIVCSNLISITHLCFYNIFISFHFFFFWYYLANNWSMVSFEKVHRYQCLFCPYSTNRSSHFETHKRKHTGERPYTCTICSKSFAQKSYFTVHQRYHSGERPFSCQKCKKSFVRKYLLYTHKCSPDYFV